MGPGRGGHNKAKGNIWIHITKYVNVYIYFLYIYDYI